MSAIPNWDEYYLQICRVVAARSKDPNTKLGCIIVGPAHEIRRGMYPVRSGGMHVQVDHHITRPPLAGRRHGGNLTQDP